MNEALGMLFFGGIVLFGSICFALSMLSFAEGKTERGLSRLSFCFSVLPFIFNLLSVVPFLLIFVDIAFAFGESVALMMLFVLAVLTFLSATAVLPCAAAGIVYAVRRVRRTGKGRRQVALSAISLAISTLFLVIWILILFEFA